eukprot:GHRQ01020199.1.p1 GENE.GHRQ01020199.1~~GHRQ01020199.1.p1  ORF type:complete len:184 (+),score=42.72 GHRQ01020199.1:1168-1719(+)
MKAQKRLQLVAQMSARPLAAMRLLQSHNAPAVYCATPAAQPTAARRQCMPVSNSWQLATPSRATWHSLPFYLCTKTRAPKHPCQALGGALPVQHGSQQLPATADCAAAMSSHTALRLTRIALDLRQSGGALWQQPRAVRMLWGACHHALQQQAHAAGQHGAAVVSYGSLACSVRGSMQVSVGL